MTIFCDFLTDVILDKSNYKFKEKYNKYGLDNIENYQEDRYDIYNNKINLINTASHIDIVYIKNNTYISI